MNLSLIIQPYTLEHANKFQAKDSPSCAVASGFHKVQSTGNLSTKENAIA